MIRHQPWKLGMSCGVERSGKCFCPPFVPQHDRDYKGRGTPLPVCARLFTACLRCTSLWHCAGLPVGIAHCAGTISPGSKGCDVSRTSRGSHLTGGLTVLCGQAARHGTVNVNGLSAQCIRAVNTNGFKIHWDAVIDIGLSAQCQSAVPDEWARGPSDR